MEGAFSNHRAEHGLSDAFSIGRAGRCAEGNLKVRQQLVTWNSSARLDPADIGKTPLVGVFVFPQRTNLMPILLWLLGVPLVVVIGLYLFHVI